MHEEDGNRKEAAASTCVSVALPLYQEGDVYYYITVENENYTHPDMPEGAEEGIRRGLYLLRTGGDGPKRVQLLGSGAILREALAAANSLEQDFGVMADVWSATSFTELRRDGVTLQRLWEEYLRAQPDGYRYTQFCEHYRRFVRRLAPPMRQTHRAGEKAFVDFSGKRPEIIDRRTTGEAKAVELFVGVLGASNYLYAEVTADQSLPAWIGAHVRMLEAFPVDLLRCR